MNLVSTQRAGGSHYRLLPAFFLMLACAPALAAVDFTLDRTAPDRYTVGASLDITVTLDIVTDESLTAMGLEETIPPGWQYDSVVSGMVPGVTPAQGKEGLLEFAWFPLPDTFPLSFTYRVNVPGDAAGDVQITGNGLGRTLESGVIVTPTETTDIAEPGVPVPDVAGLTQAEAETVITDAGFIVGDVTEEYSVSIAAGLVKRTDPPAQAFAPGGAAVAIVLSRGQGMVHDGDTTPDGVIALAELLRVIQLYNTDVYACADGQATEDGFVPGATTPRTCAPHDGDPNGDWTFSLSELLRFIQFFNLGGYHDCSDMVPPTEDGFCPGP